MITKSTTQPRSFGNPFWVESGNNLSTGPSFPLLTSKTGYSVAHDDTYQHPIVASKQTAVKVVCTGDAPNCLIQRNIAQNTVDSANYTFWTHADIIPNLVTSGGVHTFLDKQDPVTAGWGVATVGGSSSVTYNSGSQRIVVQSGPDVGNSATVYSPIARDNAATYDWQYAIIKNLKFTQAGGSSNGFLGSVDLAGHDSGNGNYLGLFATSGLAFAGFSYVNPLANTFRWQTETFADERDYQIYFHIPSNTGYVFQNWESIPRAIYKGPLIAVASTLTNFSILASRTAGGGHTASFESAWVGYI